MADSGRGRPHGELRVGDPARSAIAAQIGRTVARLRRAAGLSEPEMVARSSLSATTINAVERGEHEPRLGTMLKIAGALGVEPGDLLAGIEWREPPDTAFYIDGERAPERSA